MPHLIASGLAGVAVEALPTAEGSNSPPPSPNSRRWVRGGGVRRSLVGLLLAVALGTAGCASGPRTSPAAAQAGGAAAPIPVKVVVVTLFEIGQDTGDKPGEFQFWVEREGLEGSHPVAGAWRPVREGTNGVIAICTGMGNVRSAASITALGLDPRYDLSRAYWLVAGIAGIDPADGTLGCGVWAEHVVDGDLAHELDAREIPAGWSDGFVPLGTATPDAPITAERREQVHYPLNAGLARWAFALTRDTPLMEDDAMRRNRVRYTGFPEAQRAPFVTMGDNLAGSTFWHGALLNAWANRWVSYWTEGRGNYVTTAMEESGTLQALTWLARDGKVDRDRVLVLRTASNFDRPPPGMTAADSLAEENGGAYSAFVPSLETAHRVGSRVVRELVAGWDRYATRVPSAPQPTSVR